MEGVSQKWRRGSLARKSSMKDNRKMKIKSAVATKKAKCGPTGTGESWEARKRGARVVDMPDFIRACARLEGGDCTSGALRPEEAFALMWGTEPSSQARKWLEFGARETGRAQAKPRLLIMDFEARRARLVAFDGDFLAASEKMLLRSVARPAWIRAWEAGARCLDGMGVARCDPPVGWSYKLVNPRQEREVAEELDWGIERGALSAKLAGVWGGELVAYARSQHEDVETSLEVSAKRYAAIVLRQEIETACCAPVGSGSSRLRL